MGNRHPNRSFPRCRGGPRGVASCHVGRARARRCPSEPRGWCGNYSGMAAAVSRVVVLGGGIAGHAAAAFARKWLGREHSVTVVSPKPDYNWIPSNIWVGVGLMKPEKVVFPLAPVYERHGIEFVQAAAREIHPDGDRDTQDPFVMAQANDG